jgi:hypothetical protein
LLGLRNSWKKFFRRASAANFELITAGLYVRAWLDQAAILLSLVRASSPCDRQLSEVGRQYPVQAVYSESRPVC